MRSSASAVTNVAVTMRIYHHEAELEPQPVLVQQAEGEIKVKPFRDLSHYQAIRKAHLIWTSQLP
jgi:hypothetical protein